MVDGDIRIEACDCTDDPQEGVVLLDGVDIKTLNVRWLRSQLGYVGQEPVLFSGSVAENIAHGRPGATQAEIEEAAKVSEIGARSWETASQPTRSNNHCPRSSCLSPLASRLSPRSRC